MAEIVSSSDIKYTTGDDHDNRLCDYTLTEAGAILAVEETGEGVYSVTQVDEQSRVPKVAEGVAVRIPISWSWGPITVSGYVETDTLTIYIQVSVLGISLGSFNGSLKNGLQINVNLKIIKGYVRFSLKNGNEIWCQGELKIKFPPKTFNWDEKILSF